MPLKYASVLYYFPQAGGGTLSLFSPGLAGVPEALRERFRTRTKRLNTRGPDGGRGMLLTWQEQVRLEMDPARQTWRQVGEYWIGCDRDYSPEDVAKRDAQANLIAPGWPVLLGDGHEYVIPVALADMPNYRIPWRETLDTAGKIVRETDPAYVDLCLAAQHLFDHITDEGQFSMDEDALRKACACALSVNYKLDLTECLALGLFTYEAYQGIVRAILDLDAIDDLLKKKAVEACTASSGSPGE